MPHQALFAVSENVVVRHDNTMLISSRPVRLIRDPPLCPLIATFIVKHILRTYFCFLFWS